MLLGVLVLALGYEAVARWRYQAWRARFERTPGYQALTVASADETLLWEYRPSTALTIRGVTLETNAHGFRDVERTLERPEGVERVVFLGDSVVFGHGTERRDGLVARYEELARAEVPGGRLEALNLGVDGYCTPQIAELMKVRALAFSPQRILYVFCLNDFDFEGSSAQKVLYFGGPPRSFFLDVFRRGWRRLVVERRWLDDDQDWHLTCFHRTRDVVFADLAKMKRLADEHGIAFQVVVVPVFPQGQRDWKGYALRDIHAELDAFLTQQDIDHLDLLPTFEACGLSPGEVALDLWHLTPRGHRLVAETLAAWDATH
jgi:lysophospholipase L1-like esterase